VNGKDLELLKALSLFVFSFLVPTLLSLLSLSSDPNPVEFQKRKEQGRAIALHKRKCQKLSVWITLHEKKKYKDCFEEIKYNC
jgi:hypothetical protein